MSASRCKGRLCHTISMSASTHDTQFRCKIRNFNNTSNAMHTRSKSDVINSSPVSIVCFRNGAKFRERRKWRHVEKLVRERRSIRLLIIIRYERAVAERKKPFSILVPNTCKQASPSGIKPAVSWHPQTCHRILFKATPGAIKVIYDRLKWNRTESRWFLARFREP